MAMNYDHLMSLKKEGMEFSYGDRETMLYALGIGFGRDAMDAKELGYVFEGGGLKTVPSLAVVLTRNSLLSESGWDYTQVLHGEQRLELYRDLPPEGTLIADAHVAEAYDKGEGKGALVLSEINVRLKSDGEPLFKVGSTIFARGDGGFGGPTGNGPAPHPTPERDPDVTCELETRVDQALLYRLSGDRNPLHADPVLAQKVGFPVPILHGLCTYGTACRAVLTTICGYDHTMIRGFDVRFSAPVYPGETIITDMWRDGNVVSFQCRLKERDLVVVRNGKCTLAS
ncbi:MAG: 3-alpha,7-alpha,12-alpha-trihydroxy-5-beta-cholest-24-enoyl-CoA hydratase [Rhodospirillaceae bacterium]|jgi:acyl dehydratase|nr:3-alpha,7-alpha,12-alpha-trihydroxy-5-beta-cholest-24-enoyl-CoA hydratase [Rhodospirillaceae bacterium]MBT5191033.1 3-alpha,7-alpha,12-alpha-trihydroxy-5-beta-cholest-24-enoyl-CoA hydratase [Rhodospirillaceae bacterium]MBT5898939.1 3-alpha,7-alpha,12-alpha-trihydroxy-5-beta-cholest-24-enoyl-CoA hydratase [Rhodospirillaceae bacterium]MBT6429239.1 3-alpha,7-alpha,12-alpha-trihydroxy-5-beta-cholest-24-enoyl-CoA hydratase [Rhodospirillaceae bacterium]MBT7759646.1 3-alpha,7-alpha,12-alpha-trihydr